MNARGCETGIRVLGELSGHRPRCCVVLQLMDTRTLVCLALAQQPLRIHIAVVITPAGATATAPTTPWTRATATTARATLRAGAETGGCSWISRPCGQVGGIISCACCALGADVRAQTCSCCDQIPIQKYSFVHDLASRMIEIRECDQFTDDDAPVGSQMHPLVARRERGVVPGVGPALPPVHDRTRDARGLGAQPHPGCDGVRRYVAVMCGCVLTFVLVCSAWPCSILRAIQRMVHPAHDAQLAIPHSF